MSNQIKPTPRPWQKNRATGKSGSPILCIERAVPARGGINSLIAVLPDRCPSAAQWEANADHIVKCVNAHEDLVDTLKKLQAMYSDFSRTSFDLVEIRKLISDALAKVDE